MELIILFILICLIIYFDKKYYKTYYTPSVILSVPFYIICILYDLNSDRLGFKSFDYSVLNIWIFGLFLFWCTGFITHFLVPIKEYEVTLSEKKEDIYEYSKKLVNISFVLAVILTYFLVNGYFLYMSSDSDKVEEYLGTGIQAHLTIILKLLSIISFLSLFRKKNLRFKLKNFYIILIAVLLSVLYGTKSGVLILLVSYFFAWILFFNKRIKIIHILSAFGLGFGVFYLSYSIVFGSLAPVDFIWNHMLLYYVGGTASMNAYFSSNQAVGVDPGMLYSTIYNAVYTLTGESENIKSFVSEEWTNIGKGRTINVKTFFGTIYLYGGLFWGIITTLFFSFNIHLFFKLSRAKNSFIFLVLYCLLLAILCFGWFDFYFNTVQYYESLVVATVIYIYFKTK